MYRTASAAESKYPEYSGRMTHQIGAVRGAARENTPHFSRLRPTRGILGIGVLVLFSSGHCMYYCTAHIGLCHHLVGRGHITLFYLTAPVCLTVWRQGGEVSLHQLTLYLRVCHEGCEPVPAVTTKQSCQNFFFSFTADVKGFVCL